MGAMNTHVLRAGLRLRITPRHLAIAVIVIALAVFFRVFDWNWFRHPIERRVQAATGRVIRKNSSTPDNAASKPAREHAASETPPKPDAKKGASPRTPE